MRPLYQDIVFMQWLIPRLHAPTAVRVSSVYIVGVLNLCYDVCGNNTHRHRMPSISCCGFRRSSLTKSQRDRTVIVWSPHTLSGDRTEPVRCPGTESPLRSPYDRRAIFVPKSKYKNRAVTARSSQGLRTAPVLCHYGLPLYDFLTIVKMQTITKS